MWQAQGKHARKGRNRSGLPVERLDDVGECMEKEADGVSRQDIFFIYVLLRLLVESEEKHAAAIPKENINEIS